MEFDDLQLIRRVGRGYTSFAGRLFVIVLVAFIIFAALSGACALTSKVLYLSPFSAVASVASFPTFDATWDDFVSSWDYSGVDLNGHFAPLAGSEFIADVVKIVAVVPSLVTYPFSCLRWLVQTLQHSTSTNPYVIDFGPIVDFVGPSIRPDGPAGSTRVPNLYKFRFGSEEYYVELYTVYIIDSSNYNLSDIHSTSHKGTYSDPFVGYIDYQTLFWGDDSHVGNYAVSLSTNFFLDPYMTIPLASLLPILEDSQ